VKTPSNDTTDHAIKAIRTKAASGESTKVRCGTTLDSNAESFPVHGKYFVEA